MGEFSSAAGYGRYLQCMVVFRRAVEESLLAASREDAHLRMNFILSHVEADCRDLGVDIPSCRLSFKQPRNRSAVLGTLYVLEGSSLGAGVLAGRLAGMGLRLDRGGRHIAALTTWRNWANFLGELEGCSPFDIDLACAAALETFGLALTAAERVSHASAC